MDYDPNVFQPDVVNEIDGMNDMLDHVRNQSCTNVLECDRNQSNQHENGIFKSSIQQNELPTVIENNSIEIADNVGNQSTNKPSLNLISLNVCGLRNKLYYPEFNELITNYDLVALQETKTDMLDDLQMDGFELYLQNRSGYLRKSGGIGLAVKNNIKEHVRRINCKSEYVIWFSISKCLFNIDQDVLLGVVYLPPECSKYSSQDMFYELESDVLSMLQLSALWET